MDPREQRLYQELMRLGHDRPTAIFHPEQDESQEHVVGLLRGVLSRYEMAPDVDYRIEPLREGKSADALQFTLTSAHAFEMIYELRLDMQDRLQSLDAIFEAHADESILGPGNKEPSHTEQDEEEERRAADELSAFFRDFARADAKPEDFSIPTPPGAVDFGKEDAVTHKLRTLMVQQSVTVSGSNRPSVALEFPLSMLPFGAKEAMDGLTRILMDDMQLHGNTFHMMERSGHEKGPGIILSARKEIFMPAFGELAYNQLRNWSSMEGFAFTQDFLGITPESLRGGSERTQELSQMAVTYMERVLLNARAAFNVEDGEDKAAVAELRQGALRAGNYEFAGFIEKAQKNLMVVVAARQTAQERINEPNPNSSERKIL